MNKVETQYNSPNYTLESQVAAIFGRARSIDYITIHWWGDPSQGPSYEGVVAWLCNPRSGVSAHDVITGTGSRVAVIVDYQNAAWHAGNATGNATSLGFECDPRCRDEDYEAVAQDVADTWRYYGREIPLRPHKSWTPTTCPGNYDLERIAKRARAINAGDTKKTATEAEVRQAYLEILERPVDDGGLSQYTSNGMSISEVRDDLMKSKERKDLEAKKAREAEEYAKNEWVRNKADIADAKFVVLPAAGTRVYDLVTLQPKGDVLPRGTVIDIVYETIVKGEKYLISKYALDHNQANGIKAAEVGIPETPPAQEKPEWMKNLKDVADKDMWTRSETPVLALENGGVTRKLPVNTRVRVTHATQIVGKDLLVLEGGTEAIEVLYLNDTEVKNPYDDLEVRVSALEALYRGMADFLSKLFKGFKE